MAPLLAASIAVWLGAAYDPLMMKTIILAVASLAFCALPLPCLAQHLAPVMYLTAAETAKAKQVAQELKNAENRQRRADTGWHNFYQSYQAAHPGMPYLKFSSDFRFAFTLAKSEGPVAEVASVPLSPKQQRNAQALHREMEDAQRAFIQARKNWSDYQNELVAARVPVPSTGCSVFTATKLPSGKEAMICAPWSQGVAFTPDFRIAVPDNP